MAKNKKSVFTNLVEVAYDAVCRRDSQDVVVKSFFAEAWVASPFSQKKVLEVVEVSTDTICEGDYTAKLFIKFKHLPVGVTFAIRESDGTIGPTLIKVGKSQAMHLEFPSRKFIDLKGSVYVTPVIFTMTPTVVLKDCSDTVLPTKEPVEKFVVINPEYTADQPNLV